MESLPIIPDKGRVREVVRKINENFAIVCVAIGGIEYSVMKNKGLFVTADALRAKIPTPLQGDWALVGSSFPCALYICTTAGVWTDSEETYAGDNVNLNDYLSKTDWNTYKAVFDSDIAMLSEECENSPKVDVGVGDLDIMDEAGYTIAQFRRGHIRTKDFDSEKLTFSVEDSVYDFDIRDDEGNVLVLFRKGHIKTANFDSSAISISRNIYCIGDSTTQGQSGIDNPVSDNPSGSEKNCYPNILQEMLGEQYNVYNLGVGGQKTGEVLARCGYLDAITTNEFVLYGNRTPSVLCSGAQSATTDVIVDSCAEEPVNYMMQQGKADAIAQMAKCYVNGIQCSLTFNSPNLYINRTDAVGYNLTIPVGTHITFSGNMGDGIYLMRLGTNDILQKGNDLDVDNYIKKVKQAVSMIPNNKYLIMGMFHGWDVAKYSENVLREKENEINERLSEEFGARYIDGRAYISSNQVFQEMGIRMTTNSDISQERALAGVLSDEYCVANGITPSSFWRYSHTTNGSEVDKIHLNYDGYYIMAKLFRDKIREMNWI